MADVEFYTGINYKGDVYRVNIGSVASDMTKLTLGATQNGNWNDCIRSVKINNPAVVYAYTNIYHGGYALVLRKSNPNLGNIHMGWQAYGGTFANEISSYKIQAASFTWPTTASQTITLGDGSVVKPLPGSERFTSFNARGYKVIEGVKSSVRTRFSARFPESRWLAGFNQMLRNAAVVMTYGPDDMDWKVDIVKIRFVNRPKDPTIASWLPTGDELTINVTILNSNIKMASVLQHEFVHAVQCTMPASSKTNVVDGLNHGVIEGGADNILIRTGHHVVADRRRAGYKTWYAGYDTSAFFFYYIEFYAPTKTPGFMRMLNRTMNRRNPSVGGRGYWSSDAIRTINARKMSVTDLWREYLIWVKTH